MTERTLREISAGLILFSVIALFYGSIGWMFYLWPPGASANRGSSTKTVTVTTTACKCPAAGSPAQ